MKRIALVLICACGASFCGGSSQAPTPATPICQSQNTATVYFENRSVSNLTYDVIWDGARIATVGPSKDSATFTYAANVTHSLTFLFTNTNLIACSTNFPILTTCSNTFYSCGR